MYKVVMKILKNEGCFFFASIRGIPFSEGNVLTFDNDETAKFESLSSMKRFLYLNGYKNPRDYMIFLQFNVDDGYKVISLSDMIKTGAREYQYIDIDNSIKYVFKELTTESVTSLGYIVFNNGDSVRIDSNKESADLSKMLMEYCREAIDGIMTTSNIIKKYYMNEFNHHIKIELADCQESIYICYNGQIMKTNQERKDRGVRCLPYERSMDKFLTIYIYSTMEYIPGFKYNMRYKEFIDLLISKLRENHVEDLPKYSNIKFEGRIYL